MERLGDAGVADRVGDGRDGQAGDRDDVAGIGFIDGDAFEPTERRKAKWDAVVILGGGYVTLGACVMALRSGTWLWLSIPIGLLSIGALWYLVASRIKARARRALAGTVYALTTQRALVVRTYPALTVQALPIETIEDISVINKHPRADLADLGLVAAADSQGFVFRGIAEPESARMQLLRVIRDPGSTERELAASEAYAMAMRQLMVRPVR